MPPRTKVLNRKIETLLRDRIVKIESYPFQKTPISQRSMPKQIERVHNIKRRPHFKCFEPQKHPKIKPFSETNHQRKRIKMVKPPNHKEITNNIQYPTRKPHQEDKLRHKRSNEEKIESKKVTNASEAEQFNFPLKCRPKVNDHQMLVPQPTNAINPPLTA